MSTIVDMLLEPQLTKICAPMVRYSKLPFRTLVRKYECDVCFTPMIMADSFLKSAKARNNEFTTSKSDRPLIVQFAAKTAEDFLAAAEMVSLYSDGVDLNCGCPQRWAMKDGYGADLLTKPQLVKDLVYQVRNQLPGPYSVSIKIRILNDIKKTIDLCQTIEHTGASFLTVHARTPQMRNEPIDLDSLKLVRDSVSLPVIANGNVKCLEDAENLFQESRCNGVMVANALLSNPALFAGYKTTPVKCIQDWLDIVSSMPTNFLNMHHHFIFMLEKILPKKERLVFNTLQDESSVYEFLREHLNLTPRSWERCELIDCDFDGLPKRNIDRVNDVDSSDISIENLFL